MQSNFRISTLDYLRHLAAVTVLFSHSYVLNGTQEADAFHGLGIVIDPATLAVNFFFCLSGFLMFGAMQRSPSVVRFSLNRLGRIVPGLAICVLLTTFLMGPLLSSLDLTSYWSDGKTWRYLKNMAFVFTPDLPGVFTTVPYPSVVNGSLWTLFYEITCYGFVAALLFLPNRGRTITFAFVAGVCLAWLASLETSGPTLLGNLTRLMSCFAFGYLAGGGSRSRSSVIFLLTGLVGVLWITGTLLPFLSHVISVALCVLALHLATVVSSKVNPLPFDFSFGIYIYAFPVQQVLASQVASISPLLFFCLSLALTLPFAVLSWYLIERPAMQLIKRSYSKLPYGSLLSNS